MCITTRFRFVLLDKTQTSINYLALTAIYITEREFAC